MKLLSFSEFYKGQFVDDGFELYLLKDTDKKVLYIGISRDSIWHRWFGGGTSHMDMDAAGKIWGRSHIGEVIEQCFPASWDWMIELWTREDCLKACQAGGCKIESLLAKSCLESECQERGDPGIFWTLSS